MSHLQRRKGLRSTTANVEFGRITNSFIEEYTKQSHSKLQNKSFKLMNGRDGPPHSHLLTPK